MTTDRQRLTASHVKVGCPLPGDTYDESGHLLLSVGHVIASESQLQTLLSRGLYVDIAVFQARFAEAGCSTAHEPRKFDPFLLRDSLKKRLNRALRSLDGEPEAVVQIREIADAIHELASTDPEGAIASGLLDDDENYAVRHSVSTAILCNLTSRALGWPDDRRASLVCAALSMNAPMLDLQNKLVGQAEALTPKQQDMVSHHPEVAAAALREAGVDDPVWIAAALEHHEHVGGSGYPHGVARPGKEGQLVRLADVFGALVSPRGDRKALTPPQAVRSLLLLEAQKPSAALASALVQTLGLFPPGTFVKLANGEIAVVHRRGGAPNTPMVASIASATGNPYMKPVRRDTERKDFAIAGLIPRGKVTTGYDLGVLWVRTI
ncbi:MAG TPA: HD domain-containing phosphohydrolase [Rhodocyclaceae bacterium]|nr:HD domain-containing phosphohydrolase [Rhodocyclaceae bacterium]